jgi:hypothetical protein
MTNTQKFYDNVVLELAEMNKAGMCRKAKYTATTRDMIDDFSESMSVRDAASMIMELQSL